MAEALAIERWLASTLSGDAILASHLTDAAGVRVFADYVPEGRGYPSVLFTCITDGTVVYAQPDFEKLVKFEYRIWAVVDSADKVSLESIRDRVQVLLQSKSGSNVSGSVLFCQRISAWNPPMGIVADKIYARLGDVYSIWAQPS